MKVPRGDAIDGEPVRHRLALVSRKAAVARRRADVVLRDESIPATDLESLI